MKTNKTKKYVAPTIELVVVELEQGIAASSATVSGGDDPAPYQPEVGDWQDGGLDTQNGDL